MRKTKDWDGIIREGTAARDLYPDFVEGGSMYESLAKAYQEKGDKAAAAAQLERYVHAGGRNPESIKQLAGLLTDAGKKKEAAEVLERLNYIYPMDPDQHQKLGELWLSLGNAPGAIREFQVLLARNPQDAAQAHFDLANAYRLNHQPAPARDEAVAALEIAPGFRSAQKLLLELSGEENGTAPVPVKK
jgi:Flp pilus assembly protein TadD